MAPNPFEIEIVNRQRSMAVDQAALRRTVDVVLRRHKVTSAQISVAVVNDTIIRELKRQYFGEAIVTDVVSFNLNEHPDTGSETTLDGEVVINAQQARRLAKEQGTDPIGELHLYLVHGLLHQLGWDDQTPSQSRAMHRQEEEILDELGYSVVSVLRSES